jgi:hypothetical protein
VKRPWLSYGTILSFGETVLSISLETSNDERSLSLRTRELLDISKGIQRKFSFPAHLFIICSNISSEKGAGSNLR